MIDAKEAALTETDLLTGFRNGDEAAVKQLYCLYYRPLCYFAEKLVGNQPEAEDIAVDTFLKLLQKKQDFDNLGDIRSFVFTAARHACFDALRKMKVRDKANRLMIAEAEIPEDFAERELLTARVLQLIYTEMDSLPAQCRKVFKSVFIERKTTAEIAGEMGISTQTVLNQKSRAIHILRTLLEKKGVYDAGVYLGVFLSFADV